MESSPKKKKIKIVHQELPHDIWNQILLRLPAKTVIRFKIVCKNWCELINSRNFQISHVEHWRIIRVSAETTSQLVTLGRTPPTLLSIDKSSKVHCRPLRFDQPLRRSQRRPSDLTETTVLFCYDGLFLIRTKNHLFLCNPLTKSNLHLPFPNKAEMPFTQGTLVYDPSTRSYVIICRTRHVVSSLRINHQLNGGGSGLKIGSWRRLWSSEKLVLTFPGSGFRSFLASISINGKAHLLLGFSIGNTGILTIDAATEELLVTRCSSPPSFFESNKRYFESNQKFYCLKKKSCSSIKEALELWAIDDVNNPTWVKHQVMIKMDPEIPRLNSNCWQILKDNKLILGSTSSNMVIYHSNLKMCVRIMPIHYSLVSWN